MSLEMGSDRRRTVMRVALGVIVLIVALLAYNRVTGDEDANGEENSGGDAGNGQTESPPDADADAPTTTFADPGDPVEPTCPAVDGSSPRTVAFSGPPPMCLDPTKTYVAVLETTRGDFEITLDMERGPLAANNFAFLAGWHYYDGVGFHRIIPDFVIQGGDAVGPVPGVGGPGYEFPDEPPTEQPYYPLMSVAMANSGPNTNGSQFFIVIGPNGEALPPSYTRFGTVTAGTPVVEHIAETGDPNSEDGTPTELTVIERVTVAARGA